MIAKYALSAVALLQLASQVNGQAFAGMDFADVSDDEWASVAESANFTQKTTFKGRDVSSSYPSKEQNDWSLLFAIKDDLDAGDEQLTAGTVSISGPDGEVEFDDSWLLCVHVFNVSATSAGGFGSLTNGCDGVVAPECVDDLRKNAIKNFGVGCPSYKTTPSCLRDVEQESRGAAISINSDNAGDLTGEENSIWRMAYGTHPADEEEPSVLLEAAGTPQVVITIFGSSEKDSEDEAFGEVTCILPDTAENGTTDPTEGAASGFAAAFAGWAALTGAVAYQLL